MAASTSSTPIAAGANGANGKSSRAKRTDATKDETDATSPSQNENTENKDSEHTMDIDKAEANGDGAEGSVEREENDGPVKRGKRVLKGLDSSLILSTDRSKRRRTPTPEPADESKDDVLDPQDRERAKRLGMEMYRKIMAQRDKQ